MFELVINTNNDAFAERGGKFEIARILRQLASKIADAETHQTTGALIDLNGNKVGNWDWSL